MQFSDRLRRTAYPRYLYFPHDIKVRELSSGRSSIQSLAAVGIDAIAVPQSNALDGINVTRRMLGRTWVDGNRCERGIEALLMQAVNDRGVDKCGRNRASSRSRQQAKSEQFRPRKREHLTAAEIDKLIEAAKGNRHGHRDATMILVARRGLLKGRLPHDFQK
jgi:hypothetical protein